MSTGPGSAWPRAPMSMTAEDHHQHEQHDQQCRRPQDSEDRQDDGELHGPGRPPAARNVIPSRDRAIVSASARPCAATSKLAVRDRATPRRRPGPREFAAHDRPCQEPGQWSRAQSRLAAATMASWESGVRGPSARSKRPASPRRRSRVSMRCRHGGRFSWRSCFAEIQPSPWTGFTGTMPNVLRLSTSSNAATNRPSALIGGIICRARVITNDRLAGRPACTPRATTGGISRHLQAGHGHSTWPSQAGQQTLPKLTIGP